MSLALGHKYAPVSQFPQRFGLDHKMQWRKIPCLQPIREAFA
jgi:hypothetical protein